MKALRAIVPLLISFSVATHAADMHISLELPKLEVAEYHKPYVAVWIENDKNQVVSNLSVWYDAKMKNNEGEKWLKDMRQWWRKIGRTLTMPVDGVTGATKGPGKHALHFTAGNTPFENLPAGQYRLQVEASREVGGRELVSVPFTWPVKNIFEGQASGSSELGAVQLRIQP